MIKIIKEIGETMGQLTERVRREHGVDESKSISFAGRLDPMAHGLVLFVVGQEEIARKADVLGLDKEYIFEVLLGVETDSYDILGVVQTEIIVKEKSVQTYTHTEQLRADIDQQLAKIALLTELPYPQFSSKTTQGKTLWHTGQELREKQVVGDVIPEQEKIFRQVKIRTLVCADIVYMSAKDIYDRVVSRVQLVEGEFGQTHIISSWDRWLERNMGQQFPIATCRVICSSGTYVRTICHVLGENFGGGCAFDIFRTHVGDYGVDQL